MMPQPESQSAESMITNTTSSSNKAPRPSNAAYVDTLCGHGIVTDLSGRKLPQELTSLKERILQKRASLQFCDPAVNAVMDLAEDLACDNKLSAPKPDAYLTYARGPRSLGTVEQNNLVNHPKARPCTRPTRRNTFPALSVELKAEFRRWRLDHS
ncbi:MAG: hypothetical protein Q9172_004273 [Xanthocarpia lactea]